MNQKEDNVMAIAVMVMRVVANAEEIVGEMEWSDDEINSLCEMGLDDNCNLIPLEPKKVRALIKKRKIHFIDKTQGISEK